MYVLLSCFIFSDTQCRIPVSLFKLTASAQAELVRIRLQQSEQEARPEVSVKSEFGVSNDVDGSTVSALDDKKIDVACVSVFNYFPHFVQIYDNIASLSVLSLFVSTVLRGTDWVNRVCSCGCRRSLFGGMEGFTL